MTRLVQLLMLAPVVSTAVAAQKAIAGPSFSTADLQQILALGPWPPPARLDPSNRVSGQAQAIELGRQLFREPRMSSVGYIACVSCHQPDRSFTDNKARAHGLADLPRNTPALANLGQQRWFGWGGSSDSLWMASIRPILDSREFNGSAHSVTRLFERDPELAACYRKVFRVSPRADPQRTVANVGKALAAYLESLVTARTPFDDFRDALERGDLTAAARYPMAAQLGLKHFVGRARCVACHNGPNFSDGGFHLTAATGDHVGMGGVRPSDDGGRLVDARRLKASPLNLLGPHNDDPRGRSAQATRALVLQAGMRGQYRTPGLRNVATTGPYLHDGRIDRLQDALQHQARPPSGPAMASFEPLSSQEVEELVAFLATLTDQYGERRPWSSADLAPCP